MGCQCRRALIWGKPACLAGVARETYAPDSTQGLPRAHTFPAAWRNSYVPILHQMQVSGNCYKIRLAARQLGIALTLKDYGLLDGATRKPDFLSKNPNGRV